MGQRIGSFLDFGSRKGDFLPYFTKQLEFQGAGLLLGSEDLLLVGFKLRGDEPFGVDKGLAAFIIRGAEAAWPFEISI